jgi:hypothetical protein
VAQVADEARLVARLDMAQNRHGRPGRRGPLSGVQRKSDLEGGRSESDPERTLIAEERPRQRGSEYGLRAGDAELNRWQLRRAKVGSRQLPGPTLFGKEMEKTRGHCYVERPEKDRFCFRR